VPTGGPGPHQRGRDPELVHETPEPHPGAGGREGRPHQGVHEPAAPTAVPGPAEADRPVGSLEGTLRPVFVTASDLPMPSPPGPWPTMIAHKTRRETKRVGSTKGGRARLGHPNRIHWPTSGDVYTSRKAIMGYHINSVLAACKP